MRIGFVAEPYEEHHASGMGFVIAELLRWLLKEGSQHTFVVYSSRAVQKTFIPGDYKFVQIPSGFFKKLRYFRNLKDELDVLIFMTPLLPLVIPKRIRALAMCQELGSQKIMPGWREWPFAILRDRILMPISLRRAERVVVASHATETDVLKFYQVPREKVRVVYDGYQELAQYAHGAPPIDQTLVPYFFFAGKVKYRKNVHGIAAAFADFKTRTKASAHLVIAGDYGGEYYEQIMGVLRAAHVEQDVRFVGYINASELYSYFKNACAVVFPSINEGFGMPIIEAMSVGTPVITSNISSMAEAAGDAALLVDPFDIGDISRAMERLYTDKNFRDEMITRGYVRAKDFSWPKAAGEFLQLLKNEPSDSLR